MAYTHRMRGLEPLNLPGTAESRGTTNGAIRSYAWNYVFQQVVEYVYSWRTGAPSASDVAPSDTSVYGIKSPKTKGGLISQLADRKRYYEEVMRAAFPAETGTGAQSTSRVSQTDSGHLFSKVTALRYPLLVHAVGGTNMSGGRIGSQIDAVLSKQFERGGTPGVTNDAGFSYPFANHGISLTTAVNRQATANSFFAATAPERATAHILTTVLELMSGDVPSLLKNYRRALFDYRNKTRALNYVGSEYLNIQFGWQPLIAEYANMIRVLIGIDRMVYAESNRRKRMWDGPSVSSVSDINGADISTPIATQATEDFFEIQGSALSVRLLSLDTTAKFLQNENYAFSARYSSLVKPNSRSNGFVEKAEETLRALGLVDDPSLLWELTPWSWLVDWCANIGTSIVNAHTYSPVSGRHSVDYAYFTTRTTEVVEENVRRMYLRTTSYDAPNYSVLVKPNAYYSTVATTRSRATPFGFGTQLGSISAPQYAILVALGLARYR